LEYPILNPASVEANEMFDTVTKKLLNKYGLKTLAKGEENYVEVYEGDAFRRDMSYHQGITWPWLLGIYYNSLKKIVETEKSKTKKEERQKQLDEFVKSVKDTFIKEFYEGKTVGGISELYDSCKSFESKGTFEQAWSVAEVFRIILENI
jgi:glycogen debranching enzyme